MMNLNWTHVAARFECAIGVMQPTLTPGRPGVSVQELQDALRNPDTAPLVVHVRLAEDRLRDALGNVPWYGMGKVDEWAEHLPKDRGVVVYCTYGFWVSVDTAEALRGKGIKANVLDGGISAWRAMGLPTDPV
jgi:Fe-Mn family superoxide dismutase